jgi:hypothetical protein
VRPILNPKYQIKENSILVQVEHLPSRGNAYLSIPNTAKINNKSAPKQLLPQIPSIATETNKQTNKNPSFTKSPNTAFNSGRPDFSPTSYHFPSNLWNSSMSSFTNCLNKALLKQSTKPSQHQNQIHHSPKNNKNKYKYKTIQIYVSYNKQ